MEIISHSNLANTFDKHYQLLAVLAEKLVKKEPVIFEELAELIASILYLIELDIYIPARFDNNDALVGKIRNIITSYLLHNQNDFNNLAKVLFLLSQNNIELYYDFGWIYEEKHTYFKSVIQTLTQKAYLLLINNSSSEAEQNISTAAIGMLTFGLAVWDFKPEQELIDLLLLSMEKLLKQNAGLTAETAFQFIEGILKLNPNLITKITPALAELFAKLAATCTPLLLRDEPPLQMYPAYQLAHSRIMYIKRLLPPIDLSNPLHKMVYFQLSEMHMAKYGCVNFNKLHADLPDFILPYKQLVVTLDRREEELWKISEKQANNWYDTDRSYHDRKAHKTYFTLRIYIKYIKQLMHRGNPKGLQWHIMKYSANIISSLSSSFTTYLLEDIKDFLKILRHSVWDISIPHLKTAVLRLCAECLTDTHFKQIDSAIAIDLLWINMILTVILSDETIAYTIDQKNKLFQKITKDINKDQARALFEIRTLQWHGQQSFPTLLEQKMQQHFKSFKGDINASEAESFYYQKIAAALNEVQRKYLKKNLICKISGHEIDIAYVGEPKLAFNIDGPSHFNPVTGERTAKTIFRNHCLEKAGWVCFDINIKAFQMDAKQLQTLLEQVHKLLCFNNIENNSTQLLQPDMQFNQHKIQTSFKSIIQEAPSIIITNENCNDNQEVTSLINNTKPNPVTIAISSGSLSPRTQRMFSGLRETVNIKQFEKILRQVPDINRKNVGKMGDTALMILLRRKQLSEVNEIPKIKALIKYGALWTAPNNYGKSADDLAEMHDKVIISKLKYKY